MIKKRSSCSCSSLGGVRQLLKADKKLTFISMLNFTLSLLNRFGSGCNPLKAKRCLAKEEKILNLLTLIKEPRKVVHCIPVCQSNNEVGKEFGNHNLEHQSPQISCSSPSFL